MTKCYLCGSTESSLVHIGTRDIKNVNVMQCNHCGLVYLSSFAHINSGFYEKSGMHGTEDEMNTEYQPNDDDKRRFKLLQNQIRNKNVLDFGCGYGGFIKLAVNEVKNIYGIEIEKSAINHLKHKMGLDNVYNDIRKQEQKVDYITLFHVLEHLEKPLDYLQLFKKKLNKNGQIIIEVPNADDVLLKYYCCNEFCHFTYWGCHLYLYNEHTLSLLIKKANLKINWLKQEQRYPLSNHLYWLAKGLPGGDKHYNIFNKEGLIEEYKNVLESEKMCDTLMCSVSKF